MLRFVARHLRWFARIPLAPQIFDALLLVWCALFDRKTLCAIESLEAAALALPGVSSTPHRLGGVGFVCCGVEFAHLHGNGLLDVRLTRTIALELVASGRAEPHHLFGPSGWISFQLHGPDDGLVALELLKLGMAAVRASSRFSSPEQSRSSGAAETPLGLEKPSAPRGCTGLSGAPTELNTPSPV